MELTLPYFGKIQLQPDTIVNTEISFEGAAFRLDLNVESGKINPAEKLKLSEYLDELERIISLAADAIEQDYESGEVTRMYLEHHLEALAPEELETLLIEADQSMAPELQLLSQLTVVRAGFYPENSQRFAVLDFSLPDNMTNYVLAVSIHDKRGIAGISMES